MNVPDIMFPFTVMLGVVEILAFSLFIYDHWRD